MLSLNIDLCFDLKQWLFLFQEHKDFIALPTIEQQAAIEEKPSHINTWKYINENTVMYVPEGQKIL